MTQPYGRIGVVVAEAGAAASRHADEIRESSAELLFLKQRSNETPEAFARRCRTRLEEVTRTGASIVEARLVGGTKGRGERILARAALVRLLVTPMVRQGQGKMILAGSRDDWTAMKGLCAVVAEQVRGTGVVVAAEPEGGPSSIEGEARSHDAGREAGA
jgi:hypothetical protein